MLHAVPHQPSHRVRAQRWHVREKFESVGNELKLALGLPDLLRCSSNVSKCHPDGWNPRSKSQRWQGSGNAFQGFFWWQHVAIAIPAKYGQPRALDAVKIIDGTLTGPVLGVYKQAGAGRSMRVK